MAPQLFPDRGDQFRICDECGVLASQAGDQDIADSAAPATTFVLRMATSAFGHAIIVTRQYILTNNNYISKLLSLHVKGMRSSMGEEHFVQSGDIGLFASASENCHCTPGFT